MTALLIVVGALGVLASLAVVAYAWATDRPEELGRVFEAARRRLL